MPVTLDQMIYHGAAVRRGTKRAMVVVDMPFLTYQVTTERALLNCGRVMQETGCDAVKIEGGSPEIADTVRALGRAGIPALTGALHDLDDSYARAMALLTALLVAAAVLVAWSAASHRRTP